MVNNRQAALAAFAALVVLQGLFFATFITGGVAALLDHYRAAFWWELAAVNLRGFVIPYLKEAFRHYLDTQR